MIEKMKNLKLGTKIFLLGAGSILITAIALVLLAVWQCGQYDNLAQGEVDTLIGQNLNHIAQGVYNLIKTENEAVQEQIHCNLNVAGRILRQTGEIRLSDEMTTWTAINQFNNTKILVHAPKMMIGGEWLGQNGDPAKVTPIVDDAAQLTGENITIFQRINARNDMLRVATSVRNAEGKRAIGTYIPATNPDGTANPVIAAILKGETYRGRAFVVDTWHLTAYEPLKDKAGRLVGMLYVGVTMKKMESRVRRAIQQTQVGKTGYVFILNGTGVNRGHYVISRQGKHDGMNVWEAKDRNGRYVTQAIISKALALKPDEWATERYQCWNVEKNEYRMKIARIAYFEPWDWVIGISANEDELQHYQTVLNDGRRRMTNIMGGAGVVIALAIALFGMSLARTITAPVRQMTQAAEKIIQGDLATAVEVHARDEIGILAATLNFMTARLKQTKEGLRQSEEKYRHAQQMESVGLLARGVAHDFNNLLQAILGHTWMALQETPAGTPLCDHLTQIDAAGERAVRLVSQLLAFSRQQVMQVEVMDLNDAVADLLKMLRCLAGEHITLEFMPGVAVGPVRADGGMVDQVLLNLCVNARDAMSDGGRLTIETDNATLDENFCHPYPWAKPGQYVLLTVSDSGCGMSPEVMSHIFEPFFTTKGPDRGNGLGLATVYGIVKQHGGIIEVSSVPEKGSTFRLYFPQSTETAQVQTEELRKRAFSGGNETILLVEDDRAVRELGRMILGSAGYNVLLAADGREAVAVFARQFKAVDLVIMDIVMPNMGGIPAFIRMREINPAVQVIFASGHHELAGSGGMLADLNARPLKKPFRPEELLQEVRAILDC